MPGPIGELVLPHSNRRFHTAKTQSGHLAGIRYILAARSMTGQMIALDGGKHLGWAQPSRGFVPFE
jgi:hypothetical protein